MQYFKSRTNTETIDENQPKPTPTPRTRPPGSGVPQKDKETGAKHKQDESPNNSSSSVGSIRDIDIDQTDFISEESLISTEQELIDLIKGAHQDESEDQVGSIRDIDVDQTDLSSEGSLRSTEQELIDLIKGAQEDELEDQSNSIDLESLKHKDAAVSDSSEEIEKFSSGESNLEEEKPLEFDRETGTKDSGKIEKSATLSSDEEEGLANAVYNEEDEDTVDNKSASMEEFELLEQMLKAEKESKLPTLREMSFEESDNDEDKDEESKQEDNYETKATTVNEDQVDGNGNVSEDDSVDCQSRSEENIESNDKIPSSPPPSTVDIPLNSTKDSLPSKSKTQVERDDLLDLVGSSSDESEEELGTIREKQSASSSTEEESPLSLPFEPVRARHTKGESTHAQYVTAGLQNRVTPLMPMATPSTEHLAAFVSKDL